MVPAWISDVKSVAQSSGLETNVIPFRHIEIQLVGSASNPMQGLRTEMVLGRRVHEDCSVQLLGFKPKHRQGRIFPRRSQVSFSFLSSPSPFRPLKFVLIGELDEITFSEMTHWEIFDHKSLQMIILLAKDIQYPY